MRIRTRKFSEKRKLVTLRQKFIEYAVQEYLRKYHHNDGFREYFNYLSTRQIVRNTIFDIKISFNAENEENVPKKWALGLVDRIVQIFEKEKERKPLENITLDVRFAH